MTSARHTHSSALELVREAWEQASDPSELTPERVLPIARRDDLEHVDQALELLDTLATLSRRVAGRASERVAASTGDDPAEVVPGMAAGDLLVRGDAPAAAAVAREREGPRRVVTADEGTRVPERLRAPSAGCTRRPTSSSSGRGSPA